MEPLDCVAPGSAYQDFKIDYTSELDEIMKLKVTTSALETTTRMKLTEALRQKRLQIAMVGYPKPLALRGAQVANLTFDVKRDRSRELDELRRRGAARTQPWAEAHAVKMFSRRRTKNVLITQGRSDASASLTAKVVCERLFNQPSKKKRVLARLTSEQMREIETSVRGRRPVSAYPARCDETSEFDTSFFQSGGAGQWDKIDNGEFSHHEPVQPGQTLGKLPLFSDEQLAAPKRAPSVVTHQSSTGTTVSYAGVRSPSITSTPSYEGNVECDGSSATTPVASRLAHTRSLDQGVAGPTEASKPPNSLRSEIINDPDFIDYMRRTGMEPVESTYISYKISSMGDKIDEKYADQLSRALASVLTDTVETKISYSSFHKAAQKLIVEGSNTVDRLFMLACFGRRVFEGAPELHNMVKSYTDTVMEEWVSFMENYSDSEIARDYDIWDGEEYSEIFNEFPPPALLRVESIEPKVMLSKANSVEALTESTKVSESGDQPEVQVETLNKEAKTDRQAAEIDGQAVEIDGQVEIDKPVQRGVFLNGVAPSVLSLGTVPSTTPDSSIRIVVTPRTQHKRSRSDCIVRTMVPPLDPVPSESGCQVELKPNAVVPARKTSLQYVYDTAVKLSPAIVHTVCGVLAYFANKS